MASVNLDEHEKSGNPLEKILINKKGGNSVSSDILFYSEFSLTKSETV